MASALFEEQEREGRRAVRPKGSTWAGPGLAETGLVGFDLHVVGVFARLFAA
jgi:hypothetical protein